MFLAFSRWGGFILWGILSLFNLIPDTWYTAIGMLIFSWCWVAFMHNIWEKWRANNKY